MGIGDYIAIGVILLIVGGAVFYIIKAKKSGKKCIGCPDSASCSSSGSTCGGSCANCGGGCHCGETSSDEKED